MDIVTQIQEEVNSLASLFWNYTGILQRDAPPIAVGDEEIPSKEGDMKEQADQMATAIVGTAKTVDKLIDGLPHINASADQQISTLARLQEENDALGRELAAEMQKTDEELRRVRAIYRVVTDELLMNNPEGLPTGTDIADQNACAEKDVKN
ncbi:hypothetical protein CYMTET_42200 [Cymbomonas tetramitiformis]|uniref:Mediator of RNA polymerase II transcription subunit 21 n=1 Tax=Cymbomonas tetramitiformis TaxID=36881 RepID=A0AAE0F1H1_9CHLO|nr:hypothetical protein CYMTET_42200 [Cymbomonas tetramitiformis]